MVKFRCGHCSQKIGVPDESLGRMVKCPRCGEAVPARPEQTPQAATGEVPGAPAGLARQSSSRPTAPRPVHAMAGPPGTSFEREKSVETLRSKRPGSDAPTAVGRS